MSTPCPGNPDPNHRKGEPMARPTKLTPEMHTAIVEAIEAGNFAQIAAASNGITERTYYNWLNRGKEDLGSTESEVRESIYAQFYEDVRAAEAKAEVQMLAEMQRDEKWQRRAWWLERRFPKRWGQKAALEVSGPGGGPLAVANSAEAMEELESFLDERADAIEAAAEAVESAKDQQESSE